MTNEEITPKSFEKALAELEAIVVKLEQGEDSLEEALAAFERGIKLTRHCQTALQSAEQRVKILMEEQGTLTTHPFTIDDTE